MSTKHFFSDPTHLVLSALRSLTYTNPSLAFDEENKIIFRRPDTTSKSKVAVISGGGSGHEPAFAGYVGKGLLTASVAGTIFASPAAEQVRRAAIERVDTEKGVLIVPMNYTGDVLNFGMAAEKAKAAGQNVEFFAIGDDVGVARTKGGKVGRRGLAGGILVLKIAGALAETGASLDEVYRTALLAAANTVTLGSSLEHVHVPGREVSSEIVPNDEVEVGMGIHNEPGSHRMKGANLPTLVKTMLLQLLDHNDADRGWMKVESGDKFVLLINNLGSVSTLELAGITAEVTAQLANDYNIKPVRTLQGMYLTSLNGLGFSISLLKLVDTGLGAGRSLLELLDAPAEAVGWTAPVQPSTWEEHAAGKPVEFKKAVYAQDVPSNLKLDPSQLKKSLSAGLQRIIDAEPQVTRFDTIVGDGDCGVGLKRGAEAILKLISEANLSDDIVLTVDRIVEVVEATMDGTSGAIYAIFLNALVHGLRAQDTKGAATPVDAKIWAEALNSSVTALAKYTPAQIGDRTLIDALVPFSKKLLETKDVHAAAKAAQDGTEATKHLKASLGRSVYVGSEEEWLGKIPDPGAFGLSEFLTGLADSL
ncbi:putative dihydroxyacetone kinase [Talaromyces proteolyticus]|uniref:Dihydroxyacetone kinase n=1 Tax=Talaromyces proteolyticus TaxID=1131652 RepID=A0AAD4L3V5_9EURO|nr:putative dihydroxyacetone kinase [Talaromyces proteolyticus]KAH8705413.1 putative dihydroxyacetone kinase [Talaromyces proteolyticus]